MINDMGGLSKALLVDNDFGLIDVKINANGGFVDQYGIESTALYASAVANGDEMRKVNWDNDASYAAHVIAPSLFEWGIVRPDIRATAEFFDVSS